MPFLGKEVSHMMSTKLWSDNPVKMKGTWGMRYDNPARMYLHCFFDYSICEKHSFLIVVVSTKSVFLFAFFFNIRVSCMWTKIINFYLTKWYSSFFNQLLNLLFKKKNNAKYFFVLLVLLYKCCCTNTYCIK